MNALERFSYLQGNNNRIKANRSKDVIGECALCKRTKVLVFHRYKLCNGCTTWCRNWIIKKYGDYWKNKMPEAMNAYFEPIPCLGCGKPINILPGMTRKQFRKVQLCGYCKKLYIFLRSKEDQIRSKRSGRFPFTRGSKDA